MRLVKNREVFSPRKYPNPGSVHGDIGWGLEQPGLGEGALPTADKVHGPLIA